MLRIACLPLVLATIPAQAPRIPVNGDFEAAGATQIGKARRQAFFDHPGWQATTGTWAAQTGSYYKVTPHQGRRYLRPRSREGKLCELVQEVTIAAFGAPRPKAILTRAVMRTGVGKDRTEVVFEVLDETGTVIAKAGSESQADTEWTPYHSLLRVPATAKAVRIRLIGHHRTGKITDAFFDDVRLESAGPGHPRSLAGKPGKVLITEYEKAADPAIRRRLLVGLAGSDNLGAEYLSGLLAKEQDPADRKDLLRLLLISGQKAATAPLRAALRGDEIDRRTVLLDLDLAPFDWAGQVARLANEQTEHCSEYLEALARHGAFQKLNTLFGIARKAGFRLQILKALRKGAFSAEQLTPILSTNLHANGNEDQRYESMRLLAGTGSPRYLKILEAMCKLDSNLTHRGNYIRWAAGYNSMAAIKAMLPLVGRDVERCRGAFLQWAPGMTDPAVGDWMRETAAQGREPMLRRTAVAHMRQQPRSGDTALLLKLASDKADTVALAAIGGLSGATEAGEQLRKLVEGRSGPRAAGALTALAGPGDVQPGVEALAVRIAADSKHWQARVAAISILSRKAGQHRDLLAKNLQHPTRQVRTAAIHGLGQARDKKTIETLLAHLEEERSTTRAFVVETLVSLTGVDKGNSAGLWRSWWSTVKSEFVVPASAPKKTSPRKVIGTTATFYDLPVDTDNIVFVIDVSGSMKTEVRGDTKLATAKDEVVKVLATMTKGRRMFNVVTFGTTPRAYQKALQRATKDNIRKAANWIMRLETKGWTNIYDSLTMAMNMPGVESIFLLSDGAPSVGEYVDMVQVRKTITSHNRSLMIRINTIAVGGSKRSRRFMKKLAEDNFGKNRDHN